ncbi:MAG: MBL fold metallo-hydrolase [Prevotella sp.]
MMKIERFEVNPFQENCYVVSDETGEGIIIDCGAFYEEERRTVVEYVKDNGIELKHLISTHAHIDHNFGNNTIFEQFGLKPEVHAADEPLMVKLSEQALMFCNYRLDYAMPPVGRYLTEADTISFGSHTLSIISTPGHTPGSVFYYCKEEKVAFSGDTLFRMSIGRTDFELGSYNDIMQSLMVLTDKLTDDTTILPGHGPKTTIKAEKESNPYMRQ